MMPHHHRTTLNVLSLHLGCNGSAWQDTLMIISSSSLEHLECTVSAFKMDWQFMAECTDHDAIIIIGAS